MSFIRDFISDHIGPAPGDPNGDAPNVTNDPTQNQDGGPAQSNDPAQSQQCDPAHTNDPAQSQQCDPAQTNDPARNQQCGPAQTNDPARNQQCGPAQTNDPAQNQQSDPAQTNDPAQNQQCGPAQTNDPAQNQQCGPAQTNDPAQNQQSDPAQTNDPAQNQQSDPAQTNDPAQNQQCNPAQTNDNPQCIPGQPDPPVTAPDPTSTTPPDPNAGAGGAGGSDGGLPSGGTPDPSTTTPPDPNAGAGGASVGGGGAGEGGPGDPPWEGSRGLSGPERSDAQGVYQDSIDYDKVAIVGGSVASVGALARTAGNTVYMAPENFDGNTSNLTSAGMATLIHELGHVWQYQHGGVAYVPSALGAQAWGGIKGICGGSDDSYNWRKAMNDGEPWADWNAEQQAEAMEDYYKAKQRLAAKKPLPDDDNTVKVLEPYVGQVQSGQGAPGGPSGAAGPGDYEPPKGNSAPA